MSDAAAATADAPKKGSKKLLIIIAAVVLLLVVGGGAAAMLLKKKPVEDEEGGEDAKPHAAAKAHHDDKKSPPVYSPLDPFTVNLADRDAERYAQVSVTLELNDAHATDEIKNYMPSIRNGVLMILAHKTSADLLERAGKEKLAGEIAREAARSMGYDVEEPEPDEAADDDSPKKKKKKKKAAEPDTGPIKRVLFANIIIQ